MNWKELNDALAAAREEAGSWQRESIIASQNATDAQGRAAALEQQLSGTTPYSTTDEALQKEREAGKGAMIDFVKANPKCTETDVLAQWSAAALTGRPANRQWLLHDPHGLRQEYSANLVAVGYVPDASWESFRAFVVSTPKDALLSM